MENNQMTVYFLGSGGENPIHIGDGGKINVDRPSRFNGGNKAVNLWVRHLRKMGINSFYVPNPQNEIAPWLVTHCPTIGTWDMMSAFDKSKDLLVCTWLNTPQYEFLVENEFPFIYLDLEYKWTFTKFYKNIENLVKAPYFKGYVTHAQHIKQYALNNWKVDAKVVNEWSDTEVFYYNPEEKIPNTIGFTTEETTWDILLNLKNDPYFSKFNFVQIKGEEDKFAAKLRTCEYFLGTNQGKYLNPNKHPEEGCPRTQQEALHCGCILIAQDVIGNREYLTHAKSGFFVDFKDVSQVKDIFIQLENSDYKNQIRSQGLEVVNKRFSSNDHKTQEIITALNLN